MKQELQQEGNTGVMALLEQARQGNQEALGKVLNTFWRVLRREAYYQQPADLRAKFSPSDVVQETMVEACRDFDQFRGASNEEFAAWLVGILRNNFANLVLHFRGCQKRQVGREVPLDDSRVGDQVKDRLIDPQPSPGSVVSRAEEHRKLRALLGCLPEAYRRVIGLHFERDLSFEEIGNRCGCSAEAVRKLCTRAVRRVAGLFEGPTG